MAPPLRPGQHSTLTVPSSSGQRAWTLTPFIVQENELLLCPTRLEGRERYRTKTKHFVYHRAGILTQIYRGWSCLLYTLTFILFFFFLVLLFWTVVFMGHSCTRTTVNWEIRSHGWKEETDDLFLTYLSPLPAAGGSWVAGQQTHGFPHFSSFSVVTFLWPLPKKKHKTFEHYSKTVTSKYFRKI